MVRRLKALYRFLNPKFQNVFWDHPVKPAPRFGYDRPPHRIIEEVLHSYREDFKSILKGTWDHKDRILEIPKNGDEKDGSQPTWNNGFFPGLDVITLYSMIAQFEPSRYIEVGSGNSTKIVHKAKQDQGLSTRIISIDPEPRTDVGDIPDELIKERLEDIDLSIFDELGPNDVLFIDNSHRVLPNSDAMVVFMEILPYLNDHVLVHFHDIYLPYDYPSFMCDRFYSEQYCLAPFMIADPVKYRPVLPNYYVYKDEELASFVAPFFAEEQLKDVEDHGGSFWLRIDNGRSLS